MFFCIDHRTPYGTDIQISEVAQPPAAEQVAAHTLYLCKGRQRLERYDTVSGTLLLLGDPVYADPNLLARQIFDKDGSINEGHVFEKIKGHYYWFHLSKEGLHCGSSFGAIFPIFYHLASGRSVISSSSFFIAALCNGTPGNKRNLLERLLFNYPFFDSTWWSEVFLLPAHRYLFLDETGFKQQGKFEIFNYFGSPEDSSKSSLTRLAESFERQVNLFLPDEPFAISFTGGFDGRTLVAAARKSGKPFFSYSFGHPTSSDVSFPKNQSNQLGLPYQAIYLNEHYLHGEALNSANSFMSLTEYNGNLGRPHYEYAARQLSKKVPYILTGNFGSELFRALHIAGVMMSEPLIQVFLSKTAAWKDFLAQETKKWDPTYFGDTLEEVISDIEAYLKNLAHLEPNQQFYYFVFNEIFRKYFGPELIMQSQYFNNRTPFLNLEFFAELNHTIWSGVHSRLFEKDKTKRMKGQMFYASFIRRCDPALYFQKTNKGYSPADVLEPWRLPILFTRLATKKLLSKQEEDENASEAFFKNNFQKIILPGWNNSHPDFVKSYLQQSFIEIPKLERIEFWTKFYSIIMGYDVLANHEIIPNKHLTNT